MNAALILNIEAAIYFSIQEGSLAHSTNHLAWSIFSNLNFIKDQMMNCLLTHSFEDWVLFYHIHQDHMVRVQRLQAPELIEGLLVKEYYLSVIVKAGEPGLRIRRDVVVALSMSKDLTF